MTRKKIGQEEIELIIQEKSIEMLKELDQLIDNHKVKTKDFKPGNLKKVK